MWQENEGMWEKEGNDEKKGKVVVRQEKELKKNEGERERERARKRPVVPFAVNEYLINLLAWMYLIPRRRRGTRTFKGSAKSRGSSYQRANPLAKASCRFLHTRPGDDAVIGLALQRERSCALPVVGFLLASSGRQSRRQGKKNGDDGAATGVAWLIRKRSNYLQSSHYGYT